MSQIAGVPMDKSIKDTSCKREKWPKAKGIVFKSKGKQFTHKNSGIIVFLATNINILFLHIAGILSVENTKR